MTEFLHHLNGELYFEQVALSRLASELGTPTYVYSSATMRSRFHSLKASFASTRIAPLICYAVKANPNLSVIRLFAELGSGADVVSVGELERALKAGIAPNKIVFSGVGKREDEIRRAIEVGILQINAESVSEIAVINRVAMKLGKKAAIALRINPDVDAGTLDKISTGKKENKFGIAIDDAIQVAKSVMTMPAVELVGLAVHIGSSITELAPSAQAFAKIRNLFEELSKMSIKISRIDLGGGLAIPYSRRDKIVPPEEFAKLVESAMGEKIIASGCQIILEPGRYLVAEAGLLLTRLLYIKQQDGKQFAIIDAGMNDLIRPMLYKSYHHIVTIREPAKKTKLVRYDIVGPICESTDCFAEKRHMPPLEENELLAIMAAGAYGASMASTYNSRALPCEAMVQGEEFLVVRPRLSPDHFLKLEENLNFRL